MPSAQVSNLVSSPFTRVLTIGNRKLDYEATEVIVNIQDAVTNNLGSSKSTGSRQSRRLRDVKANGVRRRFPVTKQSSVKDLKMAVRARLAALHAYGPC